MKHSETGNGRPENGILPTEFKNALNLAEKIEQYDTLAKNILARKSVLAHILAATVEDFKGMFPKYLETLIEGDVHIREVPVEPGRTNANIPDAKTSGNQSGQGKAAPDRLREFNTEQSEKNEGT